MYIHTSYVHTTPSSLTPPIYLPSKPQNDDRITIVFIGEGGAQNGRMAECLNAAAKEGLPILFLVIDNGRAINTFTPDVATNSDVYLQGQVST
jgi:TPP-dependent pyruvate/acetoin dehydrogenase alpha subunit